MPEGPEIQLAADAVAAAIVGKPTAAVLLTRQSYQTRGITNDLQLAEKLKAVGHSYDEYRFRVFDRDGHACYSCGTAVLKDKVGGRRLYYCPTCQAH